MRGDQEKEVRRTASLGCSEGDPDRHVWIRDSFAELIYPAKMKNGCQVLSPSPRWVSDGPGAQAVKRHY